MKKRNKFYLFFSQIILLAVGLFCVWSGLSLIGVEAVASDGLPKIIYVSGFGSDSNDGSSSDNAVATMEKAYNLVTADGDGTIVVCGNLTMVPATLAPKAVTITSKIGDEDYTASATLSCFGYAFTLQNDLFLDNITMSSSSEGYGFTCNGFKFHAGKNVNLNTDDNYNIYVIGGRAICSPKYKVENPAFDKNQEESDTNIKYLEYEPLYKEGADITIESGDGWEVFAAGYTDFGLANEYYENKADINVTISGTAKVNMLTAGFKAGNHDLVDIIPDKFGNATLNIKGEAFINQLYLGSICYRSGSCEQYKDTKSVLNLEEDAEISSLVCGGQYAMHSPSGSNIGQVQTLENVEVNIYNANIEEFYLGGVDIYDMATEEDNTGAKETIKSLTINLYTSVDTTFIPGIRLGPENLTEIDVQRCQINIINDTTFSYFDMIGYDDSVIPYPPSIRVVGYVNSGSLETPQLHVEDYNPQYIEFKSFEKEKDLEKLDTNVYTRNEDIVYEGVSVDETTSTIIYVGGEDAKDENGVSIIPYITATDLFESLGGVLSFKFVKKSDNVTLWQPTVDTLVFQVPVCETKEEQKAMAANFAMQNMDGYRLVYREGTYNGEAIGQIIIAYDTAAYTVEHYQEQADGSYTLKETDSLADSIGETVTAEAKTYDHFVLDSQNSNAVTSGEVYMGENDEDHLVLKLYYNIERFEFEKTDSVTGTTSKVTYKYNETANIVAEEKTGYDFKGWFVEGSEDPVTKDLTYNVTVTEPLKLTAKYEKKIFSVTATFDVGNENVPQVTTYVAYLNTAVVKATEEYGYHFIGWYNKNDKETCLSPDKVYIFQVTETVVLVAKYEKNNYTVTLNCNEIQGSVSQTSENGVYTYLDETTISAEANHGYKFIGWYDQEENLISTDLIRSFIVNKDYELTAKFELAEYEVTLKCNATQGSVTGAGTYKYESEATIKATASYGYKFVGWYDKEDAEISTLAEYKFDVLDDTELTAKFEKDGYVVKAVCDAERGQVSDETRYLYQEEATVTATANIGYNFAGWYDEEDAFVSAETSYSFIVESDRTLTAKFNKNICKITATFDDGRGKVTKITTYVPYKDKAVVVAEPKAGYVFVGWFEDDDMDNRKSKELEYTFTAEKDIELNAVFEKEKYNVTVTCDETLGSVEGNATYEYLDSATVIATANTGYEFTGWYNEEDTLVTTDATYTFVVKANTNLTAKFKKGVCKVTATFDEGNGKFTRITTYVPYLEEAIVKAEEKYGYVFVGWFDEDEKASPDLEYKFSVEKDIELNAVYKKDTFTVNDGESEKQYEYLSEATVTAPDKVGHHFVAWNNGEEDVSENATYTFVVEGNIELTPKYEKNTYTVTATAEANGNVTPATKDYLYQDEATVTATANTGYHFVGWYDGDNKVSEEATYSFEVVKNLDLIAKFEANSYTVTASVEGNGSVNPTTKDYLYQKEATVTATANTGYHFVAWYNGDVELSKNASYSFNVEDNVELTAKFEKNIYTVTATAEANGTVSPATNDYLYQEEATVTATANTGYRFVGWYNGDVCFSELPTTKFVVTDNITLVAKFEKNSYRVTAVCNSDMGVVTPEIKDYLYQDEATIKVTAKLGYVFAGWYNGETCVSEKATYTFNVEENITLTAKFNKDTFTVTATCDSKMGEVIGQGTYEYLSNVTITATAKYGYEFIGWYDNKDNKYSSLRTAEVIVTEDITLTAKFQKKSFVLEIVVDALAGSVTGDGSYEYSAYADIKATPNAGYHFVGWYNGTTLVSEETQCKFTIVNDVTLTATFEKDNYLIETEGNNVEGTVSPTASYPYKTMVNVIATANAGYSFVGWYDGGNKVSENATYSFEAVKNLKLTAKFTKATYTVTATAESNGTVTPATKNYFYQEEATITAIPNTGYRFIGWYNEVGNLISELETTEFVVTENVELTAKFEKNRYTVKTFCDTVKGMVTSTASYLYGETASVTATANEKYHFVGWYKDAVLVSEESTYTFPVEGNVSLTAEFRNADYKITTLCNSAEGDVNGSGMYAYSGSAVIVATPKYGYHLVGWYDEQDVLFSDLDVFNFVVTRDMTLTAKFEKNTYTLTLDYASEEGSVTGEGSYEYLSYVSITATANAGYSFVGWYNGATLISSNANCNFTVTKDATLTAKFVMDDKYLVTAIAESNGSVETEKKNYSYHEEATVIATPNKGYYFVGWYAPDNTVLSGNAIYTFLVEKNVDLIAKFEKNTYTVIATAEGEGSVTPIKCDYLYLMKATVTAEASADYYFDGWYLNDEKVSDKETYSFDVLESVNLTAKFKLDLRNNKDSANDELNKAIENKINEINANSDLTNQEKEQLLDTINKIKEDSLLNIDNSDSAEDIDDIIDNAIQAIEDTEVKATAKQEMIDKIEAETLEKIDKINNMDSLSDKEKEAYIEMINSEKEDAINQIKAQDNQSALEEIYSEFVKTQDDEVNTAKSKNTQKDTVKLVTVLLIPSLTLFFLAACLRRKII